MLTEYDDGMLAGLLTADDGDIANGTPHCAQILAAFGDGLITPSFEIACGGDGLSGPGLKCYADFDTSTGASELDIFDFLAFQASFIEGDPSACDCDTSTGSGVCDLFDFICFQTAFTAGCDKE